jgi:putative oxidoreductase
MNRIATLTEPFRRAYRALDFLAPVADLALRLWVAAVFFRSGLLKLQSWDTTLLLFTNEYHVPLLSPELAAVLGTGAELTLPVFLALGLGGRLAAAALFVFNIVAVISYPELEGLALEQHQVWGLMMLVTLLRGPGALSLDHLIARLLASSRDDSRMGAPIARRGVESM